jgi:hypothetical protein
MQFNTYTVAGAHIAVWLVNHRRRRRCPAVSQGADPEPAFH